MEGTIVLILIIIAFSTSRSIMIRRLHKDLRKPFPQFKKQTFGYYMFFDVETTGLLPLIIDYRVKKNRLPNVVQIAWLVFDSEGSFIKRESFIIRQDYPIPRSSTRIHGITDKKAAEQGVEFKHVAELFLQDYSNAEIIIAHNARFDVLVMQGMLVKNNLYVNLNSKTIHCTMLNTTSMCRLPKKHDYPGYKWPTLEELTKQVYIGSQRYSLKLKGFHNASKDA
ncbi:3'-5' exonuclease [Polaribacter litorisediminis]|uniref:3'-5' exonuclease n=1 Tax=Polaribacter litorisediminis TaxID=1908341 RepID=UPI001CC0FFEF|nr:3'-5' exonuclease [Polaribacter litorisediminis]UAM99586.1 3'-5' exonuclease [Polaribacter litorisediminis]